MKLDIDIIDACLLDFLNSLSNSPKIVKMIDDQKIYYWFDYNYVSKELPLLNLKKDSVYRRLKKLCDIGIIEPHPQNQIIQKPFYSLNWLFSRLFLDPNERTDDHPYTYGSPSVPRTDEYPDNTIIIDTNINIKKKELSKDNSLVGFPSSTPTGETSIKELSVADRCKNYVSHFNKIRGKVTGKESRYEVTAKVLRDFKNRIKKYDSAKLALAINNAHRDPYHIENGFKYITPEFMLREDKIERFVNMVFPVSPTTEETENQLVH